MICLVCLSVIIQEHFDQFNLTRPVHKDMITCAILFGFTKDENKWNWNKEEKEWFFNSKSIKKTERPRLLVLHCSNWLHYNGKNPVKKLETLSSYWELKCLYVILRKKLHKLYRFSPFKLQQTGNLSTSTFKHFWG